MKLVNEAYKRAINSICERIVSDGCFDVMFYQNNQGEHVVEIYNVLDRDENVMSISDKSPRVVWDELREFSPIEDII